MTTVLHLERGKKTKKPSGGGGFADEDGTERKEDCEISRPRGLDHIPPQAAAVMCLGNARESL